MKEVHISAEKVGRLPSRDDKRCFAAVEWLMSKMAGVNPLH
jgi:hypothetical protein